MKIVVTLDNLDAAIEQLDKYAESLKAKAQETAKRIAEVGAEEVKSVDSQSVVTTIDPTDKGCVLSASHRAIVFMEFGTGMRTESDAPYADKVSVPVYPGSWSEQHANTWQQWVESGKDPENYPFNHYPRRGMYWSMQRMKREAKDIAKAVFNE